MSEKIRPSKMKIRSGKDRTGIMDKKSETQMKADQNAYIKENLLIIKSRQKDIDKYNYHDIYNIDPLSEKVQLSGENMVIRLYKENYIKYLDESNPDNIILDAYVRQIDARERDTDRPNWVNTPFPHIQKGIIVNVSPELKLYYYRMKEELAKYDPEEARKMIIPKQGDIVYVRARETFWLKEHRYYPNKQDQVEDFVKNQLEILLRKFKDYFIVTAIDIESIESANLIADYRSQQELKKETSSLSKNKKDNDKSINE